MTDRRHDDDDDADRLRRLFDGRTYDPELDGERLRTQLERVFAFMLDRGWHTLKEISAKCGGSEASVSARIRDFRKPRFGEHAVEHKRTAGGLWYYRLTPNDIRRPRATSLPGQQSLFR